MPTILFIIYRFRELKLKRFRNNLLRRVFQSPIGLDLTELFLQWKHGKCAAKLAENRLSLFQNGYDSFLCKTMPWAEPPGINNLFPTIKRFL